MDFYISFFFFFKYNLESLFLKTTVNSMIYLFFCRGLCCFVVAVCRFALAAASRATLHCANGLLLSVLLSCVAQAPRCLCFSSCGRWDLPGPGFEPMSSAVGGGFFTSEPPGKPFTFLF